MTDLGRLKDNIAQDLLDIERMFRPGVKLTLVARRPGAPDQDIVVTGDDLSEVIETLQIRRNAELDPTRERGSDWNDDRDPRAGAED